jgi:hypothetical protein
MKQHQQEQPVKEWMKQHQIDPSNLLESGENRAE